MEPFAFANSADVKVDGNAKIPSLEEGQIFKFFGVLECLRQEENLALWCAAKEYWMSLDVLDLVESLLGLPSCDCIYSVCNASDKIN